MSVNYRKLVKFLNNTIKCSPPVKIDKSVVKDATENEMKKHCQQYACKDCPIIQRCSIAEILYG